MPASPCRRLLLLLLALVPGAGVLAAADFPQEHSDLKPDPAVLYGRLDNGLRYAVMANQQPKDKVSVRLQIHPLSRLVPSAPTDMLSVITHWDSLKASMPATLPEDGAMALADVRLEAPLRPGKTLAIGLNYADHVRETGRDMPEHQTWFGKLPNAINGPFDSVQKPRASEKVDYEVELVVVIGKRGRHITREDASAHIFGYCVGNDVTARDWQRRTPQWLIGKSFDTHAPFGPWITTADEIGDPHRLGIRSHVNGEKRQELNTRELIFPVWDLIAHLSQAMTLEAGDLIFTGTPKRGGDRDGASRVPADRRCHPVRDRRAWSNREQDDCRALSLDGQVAGTLDRTSSASASSALRRRNFKFRQHHADLPARKLGQLLYRIHVPRGCILAPGIRSFEFSHPCAIPHIDLPQSQLHFLSFGLAHYTLQHVRAGDLIQKHHHHPVPGR